MSAGRAFPVVYAEHVATTAAFYESLGFARHFQFPAEGDPGYIGLRRGDAEVAVVASEWPRQQYGEAVAAGARFELFVYFEGLDGMLDSLRAAGVTVLREPGDMPWGERVAFVSDPNGNPVALAEAS